MTLMNTPFDFAKDVYLATAYTDGDTTLDVYCKDSTYALTDHKTSSLITSFYCVAIDSSDSTNFMGIAINGAAANGTYSGYNRYTLTIRTSDGSNPMVGLANTYDGTNADANIITGNKLASLPADSQVIVAVSAGFINEIYTAVSVGSDTYTATVSDQNVGAKMPLQATATGVKPFAGGYVVGISTSAVNVGSTVTYTKINRGLITGLTGHTGVAGEVAYADYTGATDAHINASSEGTSASDAKIIGIFLTDSIVLLDARDAGTTLATQVEAEAGTNNTAYMSPLRTKQAIDEFAGSGSMTLLENLTAGDFVRVINDGGTAKIRKVVDDGVGTAATMNTGRSYYSQIAYDSTNDVFCVLYYDNTNTQLEAVGATISGSTVTFGTPVAVDTNTCDYPALAYGNGYFCVAYEDTADTKGEVVAVEVAADRTVTVNSPSEFNGVSTDYISVTYDSGASKFLIAYQDQGGDTNGHTKVCTIAAGSCSLGTEDTFNAAASTHINSSYDSTAGKHLICYYDGAGSTVSEVCVGTIATTNTTFGSLAALPCGLNYVVMAYDSVNNKHILIGRDSTHVEAVAYIVSVNGTSATLECRSCFNGAAKNAAFTYGVTYDSVQNKIIVLFENNLDNDAYVITGQLFNGGIKWGEATNVLTGTVTNPCGICANSKATDNKILIAYDDGTNGKGAVFEIESRDAAIGTLLETGSAADAKMVAFFGTLSDVHSGLTIGRQYYISGSGVATTTPNAFPCGIATDTTDIILTKEVPKKTVARGVFLAGATTDYTIYHGLSGVPSKIMIYAQGDDQVVGASDDTAITLIGDPCAYGYYSFFDTGVSKIEQVGAGQIHKVTSSTFHFYTGNDGDQQIYWIAEI